MNRISSVLCLALVAGVVSCRNAAGPDATLVGGWVVRESTSPSGYYETHLTFAADGTFTDAIRSFGSYPSQSPGDLSSYSILSGTYRVQADQLAIEVNRIVLWDRFYGANSLETVRNVNTTIFDQSRFRIVGSILTLDYITYPAEAPVPTKKVLLRAE
ncbi:MAG: hypothetical protein M3P12_05310 [Gemmatimonadota bacterium]|nr:hypothetical protein [Gemmatimonadota bacterium]